MIGNNGGSGKLMAKYYRMPLYRKKGQCDMNTLILQHCMDDIHWGEGRGRDLGRINECKSINPPSGVPSDRRELIHSEMGKEKGKLEQEGEQKEGYGPSNTRQCRTLWKPLNHSETL